MGELIKFDHVSYTYPGVDNPAVNDVSLSINEGEIVLITGPSGAGKTTLCSMLNRIVPESYGGDISGKIYIKGADISQYTIGQMAFVLSGIAASLRISIFILFWSQSASVISVTIS